jgi:hypothetical protein
MPTRSGTLRLLEAIRILGLRPKTRFYQASTSELYGKVQEMPQTRRRPSIRAAPTASPSSMPTGSRSTTARPTACTPPTASCSTTSPAARRDLRHPQDHPRRSPRSRLGRRIALPRQPRRGRDWGHARDYVEGMWLMLQQDTRRLRDRHRRGPLGARVRPGGLRRGRHHDRMARAAASTRSAWMRPPGGPGRRRSALLPPGRGATADRRCRPRRGRCSAGRRDCGFAELVRRDGPVRPRRHARCGRRRCLTSHE